MLTLKIADWHLNRRHSSCIVQQFLGISLLRLIPHVKLRNLKSLIKFRCQSYFPFWKYHQTQLFCPHCLHLQIFDDLYSHMLVCNMARSNLTWGISRSREIPRIFCTIHDVGLSVSLRFWVSALINKLRCSLCGSCRKSINEIDGIADCNFADDIEDRFLYVIWSDW